jgi:hypothetical protein
MSTQLTATRFGKIKEAQKNLPQRQSLAGGEEKAA